MVMHQQVHPRLWRICHLLVSRFPTKVSRTPTTPHKQARLGAHSPQQRCQHLGLAPHVASEGPINPTPSREVGGAVEEQCGSGSEEESSAVIHTPRFLLFGESPLRDGHEGS